MSLKQKTVSGFIWTSAGMLGNGMMSFLVTMILARILLPYDFALIQLLAVFLAISNVIVDSGFSQAIIRDDNPSEKDLSSVFYFNISLLSHLFPDDNGNLLDAYCWIYNNNNSLSYFGINYIEN